MEQKQKSQTPLTAADYPSDGVIANLFCSNNLEDNKLAAIFTVNKYKNLNDINTFLEKASKNYEIKKGSWIRGDAPTTFGNKIHVFVSKEYSVQIVVGSFGVWGKTNIHPPHSQYNTVIEYI